MNKKRTSLDVTSLASRILREPSASEIARSLAASCLSQSGTSNQTGADLETKASAVLQSKKYSKDTQTLAASVLAQSNRKR